MTMPAEPTSLPNIAYIDEVEDERDNFQADAYFSGLFNEIFTIHPKPNLDDLIKALLNLPIDALVTDFNLSEAAPLAYNGEQLVSAFLSVRSDFPCFVRTSYGEQALNSSDDVNRVYSKNVADDENAGRYLFHRISLQTGHYRHRLSEWQAELIQLLKKDRSELSSEEVQKIIELDTKIESSVGKDLALPAHVKEKLLNNENNLIEETERLVADIKRALGQ